MRRLLDWERQAIVDAMASGEKIEVIAAEFGVSRSYPTNLSRRRGLGARSNGRPRKHIMEPKQYCTPEYYSWRGMIKRCESQKHISFNHYGARGIKVCERWRKFKNFLSDMGLRPPGCTLDRIDNDGNYEPTNCRWATRSEQNKNRRSKDRVASDKARSLQAESLQAGKDAVIVHI